MSWLPWCGSAWASTRPGPVAGAGFSAVSAPFQSPLAPSARDLDGVVRDEKALLDVPGVLYRGVHDLDGQPHRDERAAGDPPVPAYRPRGPGMDGQRLHDDLPR